VLLRVDISTAKRTSTTFVFSVRATQDDDEAHKAAIDMSGGRLMIGCTARGDCINSNMDLVA
jgi:hypothetical protein